MSKESTQAAPELPPGESLTVEFKSDRKRLHDDELVEALAGLANTQGGELWLGVSSVPTLIEENQLVVIFRLMW